MTDRLTPEQRKLNMSRIRAKNTKPEMIVRRALHSLGFRFRLHRRDLPGTPDVVLPKWRTAIFVSGCFFHGHDCALFRLPATNTEFWAQKIGRNRERDQKDVAALLNKGWRVVTVWECALKGKQKLSSDHLCDALHQFIGGQAKQGAVSGAGR